jgi:hypothetical protein
MEYFMRFFVGFEEDGYVAMGIASLNAWSKKGARKKFCRMHDRIKAGLPPEYQSEAHYLDGNVNFYPRADDVPEVPSSELADLGVIQL